MLNADICDLIYYAIQPLETCLTEVWQPLYTVSLQTFILHHDGGNSETLRKHSM